MKKHILQEIPNAITCCNLISGCIAVAFALSGNIQTAFNFIIIGAVFDFFDGFSARMLGVSSPIGKELDSLADVVTFGLAPSAIVFTILRDMVWPSWLSWGQATLPFVAFLMAAFSALRLAKFNLDKRQTSSFIGLPTPANALFWASLLAGFENFFKSSETLSFSIIIILLALCCYLLISEIPMFALKFKHWRWEGNEVRYLFLVTSVLLIVLLGWNAFAAVIAWYVFLSFLNIQIGKEQITEDDN